MHIIEPGCTTYPIKEIQFSDDPMQMQLTGKDLENANGEAAVVTPRKTLRGWEVTRKIRLGENVKGYKPCPSVQ